MAVSASTPSRLRTIEARQLLQRFAFADLFIEELNWNNPAQTRAVSVKDQDNAVWQVREIAQLSGFRVFEVSPPDAITPLPDAVTQAVIWKALDAHSIEKLVIFIDRARTQSLWYWRKREGTRFLPRRHPYLKGQPGDLFLSKLSALVIDLSELDANGNLPITETANRVRAALDIEQVTKAFFRDFQTQHAAFLDSIQGIPDLRQRRWYASVLLNRLMFIWFMQVKGFLDVARLADGDRKYLSRQLAEAQKVSGAGGKNRFFSHFLRDLFFEGFAKPETKRIPVGSLPLGDIPYLNGGLFLPHGIEARIESEALATGPYQKIRIPDAAFAGLFDLFGRYSWSLNDTPGGDDREINPDVLGYIFEKYINQKEFGAYYTRPEITDYETEQTVHQLILTAAEKWTAIATQLHAAGIGKGPAPRRFDSIGDLLLHADGALCQHLLLDTIPKLSLLDPACGSGAFIVAALKTLLNLTTGLIGRCTALNHRPVLQWIEHERKQHKAPEVYWLKKRIITENLYGVDIMEEAVEIAKLRLFLNLVASAEKRDQLEPLPNIEFNLLAGNSLIGLLKVDPNAFEAKPRSAASGGEQVRLTLAHDVELGFTVESTTAPTAKEKASAYVAKESARKYEDLLREKNRLVDLYRKSTSITQDLVALRAEINAHKAKAREILDRQLLNAFQAEGIQFSDATWDAKKKSEGKPEKRDLKIDDIRALQPFHWAYEFDDIIVNRGGFDAIITNPPWENWKPDAKEFFQKHSDEVTKKAMRLEDFEEEKADILSKDADIRREWLEYLSQFSHVNLWFRNAPQYRNQTAIINGRKATTDLNLYKLFTEQCTHLVRAGGRCGLVIPSGIYTDLGATQLREMLFTQTKITGLFCFENRKEIFEGVHRSFKFVILSFENGGTTESFPARFMRHDVEELVSFPAADSLLIDVGLVRKLSPDSLSILEFKDEREIVIAKKLSSFSRLGEHDTKAWNLVLQREFHMTDDARLYHPVKARGYVPLVEGKNFHQFIYPYSEPRYWIDPKTAREALSAQRLSAIATYCEREGIPNKVKPTDLKIDADSYRFVFRAVGRNTDERTFIGTIVPPNVFCPHSVSMEVVFSDILDGGRIELNRNGLTNHERLYLVSILNSFAADYQLRQKVTANVSFYFLEQLPLPRLTSADPRFRPIVERAARLIGITADYDTLLGEIFGSKATHKTHGATSDEDRQRFRAESDALVAQLYGLTEEEFAHILTTFPLVSESVRLTTRQTYTRLLRTGSLS
jgi:hypothetical protein